MCQFHGQLQSCAKRFWKTSLDLSSVILPPFTQFFPPFPHVNVGYFDDPSSCNTEITFFNIDMGVGGGEIYPYIPEKLKNMLFPKMFAHDCRLLMQIFFVIVPARLRIVKDNIITKDFEIIFDTNEITDLFYNDVSMPS